MAAREYSSERLADLHRQVLDLKEAAEHEGDSGFVWDLKGMSEKLGHWTQVVRRLELWDESERHMNHPELPF